MNNLELYEKVRSVPEGALRPITGGRLKGKTDINPMWRIKTLTEQFGPCGFGWKTEIIKQWLENGANGEVGAFIDINLYIKIDEQWSEAIRATGGSMFISKENSGLFTDDECFKKAYTDALSVACKLLGIGADVYWDKDKSKYDKQTPPANNTGNCKSKYDLISKMINGTAYTMDDVNDYIESAFGKKIAINDLSEAQFKKVVATLKKGIAQLNEGGNA